MAIPHCYDKSARIFPNAFISKLCAVRQLNSVWAGSISRRLVFVVVACWSAISTANSQTLDARLGPLVTSHAGKVSIVIEHLGSGEKYQYRADEIMPTASLIKLPLMVSTFGKFHRHELVREQMLTLDADDKVPGSGILTRTFQQVRRSHC